MNIELPATSRHHRDMTERLLKATLSPNTPTLSYLELSLVHFLFSGIGDMTVGRLDDVRSVDDDLIVTSETVPKKKKGPKVVKF